LLEVDSGTVTVTGGYAALSTPLLATAGAVTITGGDAELDIEYSGDPLTLSTSDTFDGKGITFGKDVAVNITDGVAAATAFRIEARIDSDTVLLNGIFGTPPQLFQIYKHIADAPVNSKMTLEYNGTRWVLVDQHTLGL
jgi:hypothetical protein